MARPELVIFDMDDVLCHYDLGRRLRELASLAGTTARDVRAAIWDSGFEELADAGGYADADVYIAEFGQRLGYPISIEEWIDARRVAMTPNLDVLSLAQKISMQASMAIYTNNGPLVKNHLDSLFPEAASLFALKFCSFEFGTKKPDPQSFTRLTQSLMRKPSECWFIDDKKSNVEGARIAGLYAHHFTHHENLVDDARMMGFDL
jgi:glucose-1-phosphatase